MDSTICFMDSKYYLIDSNIIFMDRDNDSVDGDILRNENSYGNTPNFEWITQVLV